MERPEIEELSMRRIFANGIGCAVHNIYIPSTMCKNFNYLYILQQGGSKLIFADIEVHFWKSYKWKRIILKKDEK